MSTINNTNTTNATNAKALWEEFSATYKIVYKVWRDRVEDTIDEYDDRPGITLSKEEMLSTGIDLYDNCANPYEELLKDAEKDAAWAVYEEIRDEDGDWIEDRLAGQISCKEILDKYYPDHEEFEAIMKVVERLGDPTDAAKIEKAYSHGDEISLVIEQSTFDSHDNGTGSFANIAVTSENWEEEFDKTVKWYEEEEPTVVESEDEQGYVKVSLAVESEDREICTLCSETIWDKIKE